MTEEMWVHMSTNAPKLCVPVCMLPGKMLLARDTNLHSECVILDSTSVRNAAITCKSALHKKWRREVDREGRNNRNNEQKQGHRAATTAHHLKNSVAHTGKSL